MRNRQEKTSELGEEISIDKISDNAQNFFKEKYYINKLIEKSLTDIIRGNIERSSVSKKNKVYPSIFLENCRNLIEFANTVENQQEKEVVQVLSGVFAIGEYLAINTQQLKNTVGNFSNSTIHKFISVFCGPDVKGEMRKSLLDSSFLCVDKLQQLRWSVRPRIQDQFATFSQNLIEEVISVKNKELSEKYSHPMRKYKPRKKVIVDVSSSYSDENSDDYVLVKARTPKEQIDGEPLSNESKNELMPQTASNNYEKHTLDEHSSQHDDLKHTVRDFPSFKLSDPIPVDYLFTNTLGASCFH